MTNSRQKGVAFEQGIARQLRPFYPHAKRGFQFRTGEENSDVIGTPFWIECKCYKKAHVCVPDYGRWYDRAYNDMVAAREAGYSTDRDVVVVVKLTHDGPQASSIMVLGERRLFHDLGIEVVGGNYFGETARGVDLVQIPWKDFMKAIKLIEET